MILPKRTNKFKFEIFQPVIDPMKRNPALKDAFTSNMKELGINIDNDNGRRVSSNMGNLSHYLPSIHPWLAIVGPEVAIHSTGFRDATKPAAAAGKCCLMLQRCWP